MTEWQQRGIALARQVADRVAALPGVQAVGYADQLPLSDSGAPSSVFWVAGRPEQEQRPDDHPVRRVSAGYFAALQARLLRGRYFTEEEVASQRRVLIINQTTRSAISLARIRSGSRSSLAGPTALIRRRRG